MSKEKLNEYGYPASWTPEEVAYARRWDDGIYENPDISKQLLKILKGNCSIVIEGIKEFDFYTIETERNFFFAIRDILNSLIEGTKKRVRLSGVGSADRFLPIWLEFENKDGNIIIKMLFVSNKMMFKYDRYGVNIYDVFTKLAEFEIRIGPRESFLEEKNYRKLLKLAKNLVKLIGWIINNFETKKLNGLERLAESQVLRYIKKLEFLDGLNNIAEVNESLETFLKCSIN